MTEEFGDADLLLVFDGWCGVCSRFVMWVQAHDRAGRVRALPNQTPGLIAVLGLTRADVDRAAWAFTRDGRRFSGAAAINRVLAALDHRPWNQLARWYRVPILGWWEERGYAWFARHRGRFARWGERPACAAPSARCTPEGEVA
ncbi:MAG: thiol-disulfide oxidoreductase DCC family protein [Geminicoccaceae bacterium]